MFKQAATLALTAVVAACTNTLGSPPGTSPTTTPSTSHSTAAQQAVVVGEVPGQPAAAVALRRWVGDLVSLSTGDVVAKCWTVAPDRANHMYADRAPILAAVAQPGIDGQFAVIWQDETTSVSVRRSEIRSGYACPYVHPAGAGNHLTPEDAEYIVQRYLSRVVGKPVNPDDVESKYRLKCNNLSVVAEQLLGKVTSFEANSIKSNGDTDSPVVTVAVHRAGSSGDIHVSLSGGIDGSDSIYCISDSD